MYFCINFKQIPIFAEWHRLFFLSNFIIFYSISNKLNANSIIYKINCQNKNFQVCDYFSVLQVVFPSQDLILANLFLAVEVELLGQNQSQCKPISFSFSNLKSNRVR